MEERRTLEEELEAHYSGPEKNVFYSDPDLIGKLLSRGVRPYSILMEEDEQGRADGARLKEICPDVLIFYCDMEDIRDRLSRQVGCYFRYRRIKAAFGLKPLPYDPAILRGFRRVVLLENLWLMRNIARIISICLYFGADALLLSDIRQNPYAQPVSEESRLQNFDLPIMRLPEDHEIYRKDLRELGFTTVAMALREDARDIRTLRELAGGKVVILLGSEADGLRGDTIDGCDRVVRIPMCRGVDSLNVAQASAIALYELCKGEEHGRNPQGRDEPGRDDL